MPTKACNQKLSPGKEDGAKYDCLQVVHTGLVGSIGHSPTNISWTTNLHATTLYFLNIIIIIKFTHFFMSTKFPLFHLNSCWIVCIPHLFHKQFFVKTWMGRLLHSEKQRLNWFLCATSKLFLLNSLRGRYKLPCVLAKFPMEWWTGRRNKGFLCRKASHGCLGALVHLAKCDSWGWCQL